MMGKFYNTVFMTSDKERAATNERREKRLAALKEKVKNLNIANKTVAAIRKPPQTNFRKTLPSGKQVMGFVSRATRPSRTTYRVLRGSGYRRRDWRDLI